MALDLSVARVFHPVQLSRRGEVIAWVLAFVTGLTLFVVGVRTRDVPGFSVIVPLFFLLSAMIISLGNWMDRKTALRLDKKGVRFQNGLRSVHITWGEIREVCVQPHHLGDKILVNGEHGHFSFRKLGTVKLKGEVKGQLGFVDGESILSTILERSGLELSEANSLSRYYRPG